MPNEIMSFSEEEKEVEEEVRKFPGNLCFLMLQSSSDATSFVTDLIEPVRLCVSGLKFN